MAQIAFDLITEIEQKFPEMTLEARLAFLASHPANAALTTSLGMEDQVITDVIGRERLPIALKTLDTGRLFAETHELLNATQARYGIEIQTLRPSEQDEAAYKQQYGINGFYDSVEARKACCTFRKLVPLNQALAGVDIWITGLRRGQSISRARVPFGEWDGTHQLIKVNPLADWQFDDVQARVTAHAIPVNTLHTRGYPSIGCEPCTRAIKPGEPERAGRWWWEQGSSQECGLHEAASQDSSVPA